LAKYKARRIADDLARSLPAHAQEAAAVRVVGVAAHADEASVLDVDEHPAPRWMTVHRAQGADAAEAARALMRSL